MKTLNVIGAGRVGATLAALWQRNGTFAVRDVLNGTRAGALESLRLIGAGAAAERLAAMRSADVWVITTPDRQVPLSCAELAASGSLRPGDVVFHCSGSMNSSRLGPARACGAHIASIHPLKSFADAADAVCTFAGTFCAAEGDAEALAVLTPAFENIGGRISPIDPHYKTLYHAASVIVSNYLTALIDIGVRAYEKAAIPRATALMMIEPIVGDTLQSVFKLGTVRALTGPISRGDEAVVERHLEALSQWDADVAAAYRTLGIAALNLAREQAEAESEALSRIETLLRR